MSLGEIRVGEISVMEFRRQLRTWLFGWPFVGLVLLVMAARPQSAMAEIVNESESATTGQIVLVAGAPGTDEYRDEFAKWSEQWRKVAEDSETPIRVIGQGENSSDQDSGETDRDQLQAVIASFADEGTESIASAPLWVVLIGHGTFTRGIAKFNMRGPDVTATELGKWLQSVRRPVVVVNCASASGPFVNRLSGKNRIIVSATKSGTEYNYARFGKYFASAIAAADSDLDHDDEVSVHEAFLRASADVRAFYTAAERIVTEHALLDDNGDGKGTPATMFRGTRANATAKDGSELDGKQASRVTLAPAASRLPFTDAEFVERTEIESELDRLRLRKRELDPAEYDLLLEPLMLRLAKIYQAAESRKSAEEG